MKFLNSILSESEYSEFLTCFKENRPFYIKELSAGIPILPDYNCYKDLDSLKNTWNNVVDVHDLNVKDESSTITTTTEKAFESFDNGCGLLFNDINNLFQDLNGVIESIKDELGLPQISYGRNLLYATPENGGSATHFDQNFNIIIQLTGKKTWNITENHSVSDPITRHALGQELDPELSSYIDELPEDIDSFDKTYELDKGSFLFVPVGHWHNTHAQENSLALNFTFSTPSWAELLLTALRARLVSSPNWRKRAYGFNSKQESLLNIMEFQKLIDSLGEDISNWDAGMILSMLEGRDLRS
jgi:50S ribosomal protein L16 3-hydroxylase